MSNRKQSTTGRIPRKVKANTLDTKFNPYQLDSFDSGQKSSVHSPGIKTFQGMGTEKSERLL